MKYDLGSVQGPAGERGPAGPQGPAGETKIKELIKRDGINGVIYENGFGYLVFNANTVRINEGKTILHKMNVGITINAVLGSCVRMLGIDGSMEHFEAFTKWYFTSYAEGGQVVIKGVNTAGGFGGACDLNVILFVKA